MNPVTDIQPPQLQRSSFSCEKHCNENVTGFCPSCLCERLTTLDQQSVTGGSSRRNSTSTAIKSIFAPAIRRTKSFSANSKHEGFGLVDEPQRKSCDVRNQPDIYLNNNDDVDEIRVSEENDLSNIVEENADVTSKKDDDEVLVLPMKEHMDLLEEANNKTGSTSRSNFWSAASVLSKKWQKWRRKHQKKHDVLLPVQKPMTTQFRDTQSEIADYGYGRRSCDTDPRFSLDAGRVSFDEPPRASWDGYLIGRTFPRLPPMVEEAPHVTHSPSQVHHVPRSDMQIPVEEEEDKNVPGGSIQTREYYLDSSSSSKRRKSLDRSNSIRKMAAAVVAELDQPKVTPLVLSNTKVSPDYTRVHNEPPRVSNSNSLRDDCFELGFRDSAVGVGARGRVPIQGGKKEIKKPRRWKWKLWGFSSTRGKDDDEDRRSSVSGVGRSYSESWQDGHNSMNYGINGGMDNRKVFRSNSSVSWRSSFLRKTNSNMVK